MIAGRLNEIVSVWKPTTQINDYGERVETWVKVYDTRARVEYTGGRRAIENDEIWNPYSKRFELRSYVPIDEQCQIKWQNQMWRILTIERNREFNNIIINAELVNE